MRLFGWWALFLVSCAEVRPAAPPPVRPVERSSVDALLRHRGELELTDEQVTRLEQLDQALEREVAEVRQQLRSTEAEHAAPPPVSGFAGGRGRGGDLGGMRGGGMARGGQRRADPELRERLLARIDDADTRAFVDAETKVLAESQRTGAEKVASDYRARLFDFREAMKSRAESP